jgi:hypothetical protein
VNDLTRTLDDAALTGRLDSWEEANDLPECERTTTRRLRIDDGCANMCVFESNQEVDVRQRRLPNVTRAVRRKVDPARLGDLYRFRKSRGSPDVDRPKGLRRHGEAKGESADERLCQGASKAVTRANEDD